MILFGLVFLLSVRPVQMMSPNNNPTYAEILQQLHWTLAIIDEFNATVQKLNNTIRRLGRQQMLDQFYLHEKIRTDGDSGLKQTRKYTEGTRPYHSSSHIGRTLASIHDHANNIITVGMGEVSVVMNGIEFRTRHNDYPMAMPSRTSQGYHVVEPVPKPEVPPEVLQKPTIQEQIVEMREWFKAWQQQDPSVRDYRKYFKPVLCYMEGAWTYPGEQVDEPFYSDRHQVDAKDWFTLEEQIRFLTYSGSKHTAENMPYLPRMIINITSDNVPIVVQWNYRILCHPLSRDLKLDRLRVVDDLKGRIIHASTMSEYYLSKKARFTLNAMDSPNFTDKVAYNKLLEELMNEIPGKDNYPASIKDYGYDGIGMKKCGKIPLNAGYYHRSYCVQLDQAGSQHRNRGFADQNLFMALTTHSKVAGMDNIRCHVGKRDCPPEYVNQKWSYAIPLEIIYTTPLGKWNPYDIPYRGQCRRAKIVTAGGRDGSLNKPYNGSCNRLYYHTPTEFYTGEEFNPDPADTSTNSVYMLDRNGKKRAVRPSGIRIILPEIAGVGISRQRYPISPVHGEGSGVWKELEALQDIVLNPSQFSHMYYETANSTKRHETDPSGDLMMKMSSSTLPSLHNHELTLTANQRASLSNGETVTVDTSLEEGHTHTLELVMDEITCSSDQYMYRYSKCDGVEKCWDEHPVCIYVDQ